MIDLGSVDSVANLLGCAENAEDRFGEMLWFRGQSDASWGLIPSAHRYAPILESQFAQHFRFRAPAVFSHCPAHKDYVAWLPLMQHYRLPTRLLDWSESLLVAAFFAITDRSGNDGAIWVLAPGAMNATSIGSIIPFLTDERVTPLVNEAFGSKEATGFADHIAVLAPRTDQRMAAQLGNYTIHRGRAPLEAARNASKFLARITIPSSAAPRFRRELSLLGVRECALFPDLEHLAKEVADIKAFDETGNEL